jgi:hypothetical protein
MRLIGCGTIMHCKKGDSIEKAFDMNKEVRRSVVGGATGESAGASAIRTPPVRMRHINGADQVRRLSRKYAIFKLGCYALHLSRRNMSRRAVTGLRVANSLAGGGLKIPRRLSRDGWAREVRKILETPESAT